MSRAAGRRWWEYRETITPLSWSFTVTWTTDLESMPSMRWEEVGQARPLKDTKLQHQVSLSFPTVSPNHVTFTDSSEASFITYWTLKYSNLGDNWFSLSFKLQSKVHISHAIFLSSTNNFTSNKIHISALSKAPDKNPENIKIEGHLPHEMDINWEVRC